MFVNIFIITICSLLLAKYIN